MSDMRTPSSRASATAPALAGRAVFEPLDDRSNHRYTMGGAVTCTVGKIVNLSTRGALVTSRMPLGSVVPFCVTDGAVRVQCDAKVLRTRRMAEHRHSCALQFDGLRPEDESALEYLIARHRIPTDVQRRDAA